MDEEIPDQPGVLLAAGQQTGRAYSTPVLASGLSSTSIVQFTLITSEPTSVNSENPNDVGTFVGVLGQSFGLINSRLDTVYQFSQSNLPSH